MSLFEPFKHIWDDALYGRGWDRVICMFLLFVILGPVIFLVVCFVPEAFLKIDTTNRPVLAKPGTLISKTYAPASMGYTWDVNTFTPMYLYSRDSWEATIRYQNTMLKCPLTSPQAYRFQQQSPVTMQLQFGLFTGWAYCRGLND